jgi:hypothetical protein
MFYIYLLIFSSTETEIPDVSCQQYKAIDGNCSAIDVCMNCDHDAGCYAIEKYPKIGIKEYGRVLGDTYI